MKSLFIGRYRLEIFPKDLAQNHNYRVLVMHHSNFSVFLKCARWISRLLFLILIDKSTLVWILFFPIIMAGILLKGTCISLREAPPWNTEYEYFNPSNYRICQRTFIGHFNGMVKLFCRFSKVAFISMFFDTLLIKLQKSILCSNIVSKLELFRSFVLKTWKFAWNYI